MAERKKVFSDEGMQDRAVCVIFGPFLSFTEVWKKAADSNRNNLLKPAVFILVFSMLLGAADSAPIVIRHHLSAASICKFSRCLIH